MDTRVYINDREACSKASDGASTAAFPDPCWSPPVPPVVIPYPNTAKASTLANGTTTVFVKGTMVAVEDHSFFATSTGDEPATQAYAKGVATGVIKGKAYFQSWSPNVKFEGKGVARHLDLMTHNHGSFPSNTPAFPYISRGIFGMSDCSKEKKKTDKACDKSKDDSETKKKLQAKSKLLKALKKLEKKKKKGNHWHWTDDHCAGLEVKIVSVEDAENYLKEMEESFKALKDELNMLTNLKDELTDMALNAAGEAAAKWAAKAAAKQVVGSALPGWGNAAMGVISAVDAAISVGDVMEIKAAAEAGLEQIEVIQSKMAELEKLADKFTDFGNKTPEEKLKLAQELATDGQDLLAALNACTRAKKCNLVPYSTKNAIKGARGSKVEPSTNGGCCEGQTGHHLIYDSMMTNAHCSGYHEGLAPTVCVEGTSQNMGSHGRVHDAMDDEVSKLAVKGESNGTMSMDQAIDSAVRAHKKAFPYAGCSNECIRAQLEAYYKKLCPNARPTTTDKNGNQHPGAGSGSSR